MPPLLEYLESLLTGTGHDLDLRTFKLVDQLSGRTMGVRADITPQVARIDAHLLNREGRDAPVLLRHACCTPCPRGLTATREPLQIGAEIYGHAGIESDLEIQQLLRAALTACGLANVHLDIGHVGVFRAIARRGGVDARARVGAVRSAAGQGSAGARALIAALAAPTRKALRLAAGALRRRRGAGARGGRAAGLSGDRGGARRARRAGCARTAIAMSIDLADLRGYHYHSGVVFAAYGNGLAERDRARRTLRRSRQGVRPRPAGDRVHHGPARAGAGRAADPAAGRDPRARRAVTRRCRTAIERLRQAGEIVIQELPGHEATRRELGCERRLVRRGGKWEVEAI